MGDSKFGFFVIDIILLIVFLGLIQVTFRFTGLVFLLQVLFAIVMMLIAFIALIPAYSGSRGGWAFLSGTFFLIIIGLWGIYLKTDRTGKVFLVTLLLAAVGFLISIASIKKEEEKIEETFEERKEEESKEPVYTNFEPGKYLASKGGSTYHIPKCDWAKKIKEQNRIWLNSDEEAKKKGYKKHNCLK